MTTSDECPCADCDACEDCGLVDCVCVNGWDYDDDPCECAVCGADDDDDGAAAAEYVRRHNGDLFAVATHDVTAPATPEATR